MADEGSPDLAAAIPFADLVGVETVSVRPDEVRARLAWTAERCTAAGVLHGGALMLVQTEVHDQEGRRVAHVVQTQAVIQPQR